MWDEILGKDGIVRQLQWTSRVEGSMNVESKCKWTHTYPMCLDQRR